MEAELVLLDLELIDDHPKNPRVVMREDVIDGIVANMNSEYPKQHAMRVRPVDGRYQLISGHHRKKAAAKKGFTHVWCWVESLDDDEAFMQLVTSNNQGELDPLEIGIHAFEAVPLSSGGRGKKGGGLAEYASRIGQKPPNVTLYRQAGEVAKLLYQYNGLDGLLGKALHLAAIHKLPSDCWLTACRWVTSGQASAADVRFAVDKCIGCIEASEKHRTWFPVDELFGKTLASADFARSSIEKLCTLVDHAKSIISDSSVLTNDDWFAFHKWLVDNAGADSWNYRKVDEQVEMLKARIAEAEAIVSDNWHLGDYADHIDKLADGSVRLVLTDPPFGMDFQSNRRAEKHDKIDGDGSILEACDILRACIHSLLPKMDDDCHVLVFCRWDSEGAFQSVLRTCGLTVKGSIIWNKDNHGSGDLRGGFAPKHERIIHAVKGSPALFVREPDVLDAPKVPTDNHPTEKPVALLSRLISATTVEGQLVVDPFAGVGSTCVAANELKRRWFGCELNEEYYAYGSSRLGG